MDAIQQLLSVEESAKRLNLGRTTTFALIASGALPSVKIGRRRLVPVSAITQFIERLSADQDEMASA